MEHEPESKTALDEALRRKSTEAQRDMLRVRLTGMLKRMSQLKGEAITLRRRIAALASQTKSNRS